MYIILVPHDTSKELNTFNCYGHIAICISLSTFTKTTLGMHILGHVFTITWLSFQQTYVVYTVNLVVILIWEFGKFGFNRQLNVRQHYLESRVL